MIQSYFQTGLRLLWKKRAFTLINIVGLAIGLSAVLIISTYVREEMSYDRFHEDAGNIYRVTEKYKDDVMVVHSAKNHGPLSDVISGRVPGLKHAVRVLVYPAYASADKITKYREDRLIFADSTFFDVFTFRGVAGNPKTALLAPFSVVMTESSALKYFGKLDVLGREIVYEDERASFSFYVTAVIEDVPPNSHLDFDMLFNMASLNTIMPWFNNWHYPPMYLYIEGKKGSNLATLEENIQKASFDHQPPEVRDEKRQYFVQPITDIHLYSFLENEWKANNRAAYVHICTGIAAFLLLIACINFMNLSTAQAAQRAREVGVRKVLGAVRQQLVKQFMTEAFLICFISLLFALGIAELMLMTFFNDLLDKDLSLAFLLDSNYILALMGLLTLISLMSGLYPSFYLSRFKTVLTLKGKTEEAGSVLGLRRVLVVFQFFVAAILIIGTLAVLKQISLLQNKHLGFDRDALIAVRMVDRFATANYLNLKSALLEESVVLSAALSSEIPGGQGFHGLEVNPEGFPRGTMSMNSLGMDEDYLSTYNVRLISGRNFSEDILTDGRDAVMLNESAVKALGWTPEGALGKSFEFTVYTGSADIRKARVIGVVADFNYQTLHHQVEPLVLYINKHQYYSDFLTVKFASGRLDETLDLLRTKWRDFHPEKPLDFTFLDDELQKQYASEMRIGRVFTSFAVLSIAISCLGLLGLSAFSAQRRVKEIAIRKVMGASVVQILRLLAIEYIVMITVAVMMAGPLAYYFANRWLDGFPYRAVLGFETIVFTLTLSLLIGLITVSLQSMRAAMINPVKTLKSD